MNKYASILGSIVILVSILFFSACDCIEGEGPIISETRDLTNFDGIDLDLSAEVYIEQSDVFSVRIEAQKNILDILETRIKGGVLCFEYDNICVRNRRDIEIYISMPAIREIYVNGSGDLIVEDRFDCNKLDLDISGSGSIEMNTKAEKIEAKISGSGGIFIEGATEKIYIKISGSGSVSAYKLDAEDAYIDINGSGDCRISAEDYLEVDVSGSGSVYYKGNPKIRTDIRGSGSVKRSK